jgi:polar amino acid transport system substrate-binding protein
MQQFVKMLKTARKKFLLETKKSRRIKEEEGSMMKSINIVFGMARAALCCEGHSASQPNCGSDAATLKVGMEIDYPPFEYVDSSAQVTGFDVAVACALRDTLGYSELEITNILRQDQSAALLDGTISLAISAQSIPLVFDPATSSIAYVKYNDDSTSILFFDVIPDGVTSQNALDFLNSSAIPPVLGVLIGTREASMLSPTGPFANLAAAASFYQSYDDAISDFEDGDLDGLLLQGAVANVASNEAGGALLDELSVPASVGTQGLGIEVAATCCQLYANVREAITELEEDGTLPALRDEFDTGTFSTTLTPPACADIEGVTVDRNAILQFIFDKYCPCEPVFVGLPLPAAGSLKLPIKTAVQAVALTLPKAGASPVVQNSKTESSVKSATKATNVHSGIMTEKDVIAARERVARADAERKKAQAKAAMAKKS